MELIKRSMEDFNETVKSANLDELKSLRDALYNFNREDVPGYTKRIDQLREWTRLAKALNPDCEKTRMYHYLILSGLPEGVSIADDLEGDLSAEKFLRAKNEEEREKIINNLKEQESEMAEKEKRSA